MQVLRSCAARGIARHFCSAAQSTPQLAPRSQPELDFLVEPISTRYEYKDGLRYYVREGGRTRMPGVTSILNKTKPEHSKLVPALLYPPA